MKTISNPFSMKNVGLLLGKLDEKNEKVYLGLAVLVTILGYAFLALFPILLLTAVLKLVSGVGTASSFGAWLGLFAWLLVGAAAAVISFTLVRVKTKMPSGLGLKDDKAPEIHEMLNEYLASYKAPSIKSVILHDQCSLDIIPVPSMGLPLVTKNVLHIGLPALQCLSPNQFRGLLARRIGQYSAKHNRVTHWIYRFRQYCQQYQRFYKRARSPVYKPVQWFYRFYTPFLLAMTNIAARKDELKADSYALDVLNDTELADMILRYEVCCYFLQKKYWPQVLGMIRKSPTAEHAPHVGMGKMLKTALGENESAQIIKVLMNSEPEWHDPNPGLYQRLDNIGQSKLNMPPPVMETAAQRFLGNAYGPVLKTMDKQLLAKYTASKSRKSRTEKPGSSSGEQTQAAPTKGNTADREAMELARNKEKTEGKAAAIAVYQDILKKNPQNNEALFEAGRILLSQNNQKGVQLLEKAMQINDGCVAQGCWMLAKYFKAIGDEQKSRHYLERAASVSDAA